MKLRNLKRITSFIAASALTLGVLAGCSSDPSSSEASSTANTGGSSTVENTSGSGEQVTLRVCWWGNQTRNDYTMAALDLYTEQNPNVTFEVEFSDWDGYWDKLATQAASGNMADIIQMDYAYLRQYQEKNQLAGLNEYIDAGLFDTNLISDSILASGRIDGELYAVCAGMNAKALLVRTDIMEQCGVTLPDQPTYEELFEAAATIYEQTGMQIDIPSNDEQSMLFIARSVGETIFLEDGSALAMEDGSIALRYYQMLLDTLDAGYHVSAEMKAEASTNQQGLFEAGKTWCVFANSNQITNTIAQSEDDVEYAILMYPTTSDAVQQTIFLKPSQFWSVTESSENKQAAIEVINFLTNSVEANMCLLGERGVPINSEVSDAIKGELDEVTAQVTAYIEHIAPVATEIDPPFPAAAGEIGSMISDLADQVRFREITPQDAAAKFFEQSNELLQKGAS